jgi:hypothetical protein
MNTPTQDTDLDLAHRISREGRTQDGSPYAGKYVGILDGKVVVVADSAEEGLHKLRALAPDPKRGVLIDPNIDYDAVHEIWDA